MTKELIARLLAHAECHDACTSEHSDEQARWAADLREAARLLTATTNEAAAQAEGRELEPTAMRLARLIITEHYADEPSAESLVDEAWRVLGCLPETVVNRALDLTHGARMPYEQALNLAISEHATQPVQAQGEAVAEVLETFVGTGSYARLSANVQAGTKLYTHPAPAVDRGLSEADAADARKQAGLLEAMAHNYATGHSWDHLDGEAVTKAAKLLRRAALAASAPSQAGSCQASGEADFPPDGLVAAMKQVLPMSTITAYKLYALIHQAPPADHTLTDDAEAWTAEQLDGIALAVREQCGPATAVRVRAILAASSTTAGECE